MTTGLAFRLSRALVVLAALGAAVLQAHAVMMNVPCDRPYVFRDAAVNVVVLPFALPRQNPATANRLAQLVQREALRSIAKFGSVASVQLNESGGSGCSPEEVRAKLLGTQPSGGVPVAPGRGLVLVWGRIVESGDSLYSQVFVDFVRSGSVERLQLAFGDGQLVGPLGVQGLSGPQRSIDRALRSAESLHAERADELAVAEGELQALDRAAAHEVDEHLRIERVARFDDAAPDQHQAAPRRHRHAAARLRAEQLGTDFLGAAAAAAAFVQLHAGDAAELGDRAQRLALHELRQAVRGGGVLPRQGERQHDDVDRRIAKHVRPVARHVHHDGVRLQHRCAKRGQDDERARQAKCESGGHSGASVQLPGVPTLSAPR